MKKVFVTTLTIIFIVLLSGCGKSERRITDEDFKSCNLNGETFYLGEKIGKKTIYPEGWEHLDTRSIREEEVERNKSLVNQIEHKEVKGKVYIIINGDDEVSVYYDGWFSEDNYLYTDYESNNHIEITRGTTYDDEVKYFTKQDDYKLECSN